HGPHRTFHHACGRAVLDGTRPLTVLPNAPGWRPARRPALPFEGIRQELDPPPDPSRAEGGLRPRVLGRGRFLWSRWRLFDVYSRRHQPGADFRLACPARGIPW